MLKSGVHATLAGVLMAMTIPARRHYDPAHFETPMDHLMQRYRNAHRHGHGILTNHALRTIVQAVEAAAQRVETPLQRLEHLLHLPVALLVVPVFALVNAGVAITRQDLTATPAHPITLGVGAGPVLGKFIGIAGSGWLALRLGVGVLPRGTRHAQIGGVAMLGGSGFTMSIFIAGLSFSSRPDSLALAKTGILCASLCAGILSSAWPWFTTRDRITSP